MTTQTETKIDEILENTRAVKTAVVSKEEKRVIESDKRKQALRKAQSKFKKVGTNLAIAEADLIEQLCAERGITVSAYVKALIEADLKAEIKPSDETLEKNQPESHCTLLKALKSLFKGE
jgi:uncharacterized protein YqgV (UPF0045/DUF77 family)